MIPSFGCYTLSHTVGDKDKAFKFWLKILRYFNDIALVNCKMSQKYLYIWRYGEDENYLLKASFKEIADGDITLEEAIIQIVENSIPKT